MDMAHSEWTSKAAQARFILSFHRPWPAAVMVCDSRAVYLFGVDGNQCRYGLMKEAAYMTHWEEARVGGQFGRRSFSPWAGSEPDIVRTSDCP